MQDRFPSTRHSLILAVRDPGLRDEAVTAIAEIYWKPAYKYIRLRWNRTPDDAQDLTQDFFTAALLERLTIAQWDPSRASFRTFLRLAIDGHVKNGITAAARLKRGGGLHAVSLDDFTAAERELASVSAATPEDLFHREWQRRMFELAVDDLRRHCHDTGHALRYAVFAAFDLASAEPRPTYGELAGLHGIPVTTVTNHLAWCRRQLRQFVEARLAGATSGEEEARREMRELFAQKTA